MRTIIFTPTADFELSEAVDWYEHESVGLGRSFYDRVSPVVERIRSNPFQFPVVHNGIRRALLQHFPYALFFVVEPDDSLTVIACFHGSRNPIHWQRREK